MSDPNTQWRYSAHNRQEGASPVGDHGYTGESAGDAAGVIAADPILSALVERDAVTAAQCLMAAAWAPAEQPLWRTLIRVVGVNREAVFAEVAAQSGIQKCDVNAWEPPDDLVESILALFGAETIEAILKASLLPVEVLADQNVADFTLSFATFDPTNEATIQVASTLGVSWKFSYAPEAIIQARISGLGYAVEDGKQDIDSMPVATNGHHSENGFSDRETEVESVPSHDSWVNSGSPTDYENGVDHVSDDSLASSEYNTSSSNGDSDAVTDEGYNDPYNDPQTLAGDATEANFAPSESGAHDDGPVSDSSMPIWNSDETNEQFSDIVDSEPEYAGQDSSLYEPAFGEAPTESAFESPDAHVEVEDSTSDAGSEASLESEWSPVGRDASDDAEDTSFSAAPHEREQNPEQQNEFGADFETEDGNSYGESIDESVRDASHFSADDQQPVAAAATTNGDDVDRADDLSADHADDHADDPADDPADDDAKYTSPYVELVHDEFGSEVLVDDVFADISSAITIIEDVDETADSLDLSPSVSPNDAASTREAVESSSKGGDSGSDPSSSPAVSAAKPSNAKVMADASESPEVPRDRVVVMLLHKEAVTKDAVSQAVKIHREEQPKEALWRLLAQVPGVDRDAVYAEAASVYAFPMADISDPDPNFARLVMETFSEDRREMLLSMGLLPLEYDMDTASGSAKLVFATHDPARPDVHRVLQQLKLGRFELKYAPESDIKRITAEIFPRRNEYLDRMTGDAMAMDLGTEFDKEEGELIDEEALEAEISRSTLINLFEATLVEATRSGASDIHIYPNANRKVEIHFRTDGRLKKWHVEDKVHPEAFLAVVKDNSTNVDRFERDAAQDGFIQRKIDDALIRFRVSVLPIATASSEVRAESIVIRVLDDRKVLTDLRKLGMLDVALQRFDKAIRQPHGMVILTGPTGSGKSTTLVAALHQVVTPEVNVLTVEDPVEYIIKGVRQIKLSNKLSLEQALRAILRHDPDVVMVGEMRDQQTAELAIKLANTGHLTFSTLHTNDAPSAVSRLYKMGIEPFLIAYAINLVVAQRLLRTLCPDCKTVDTDPDRVLMKSVGFTDEELDTYTIYKAGGKKNCKTCKGSGYKGRRAMCETLYFSRDIRHIVVESGEAIDEDAIRDKAREEGMLTLQDSAREIVKMGETSMEELIRSTTSE